jgi:hypothetical protein
MLKTLFSALYLDKILEQCHGTKSPEQPIFNARRDQFRFHLKTQKTWVGGKDFSSPAQPVKKERKQSKK